MEVIPVAKKEKGTRQKKKKGRSTQELLGIKTFTKYGLAVGKYELFILYDRAHQYLRSVQNQYRD